MRARIHRGAEQVGGTTVELESGGKRLVLDVGLPLDPSEVRYRDLLPDVPGLWSEDDGSLLGVLISHGHPDHFGLADLVRPEVPIYMSEAGRAILSRASFHNPRWPALDRSIPLPLNRSFEIGPFKVTTFRVDHSAFDSRAFQIEAGGSRLIYSGDFRGHGRDQEWMGKMAAVAAGPDCLIMEGTNVGRSQPGDSPGSLPDEQSVEDRCVELFSQAEGMALAFFSAQNVDRLISIYNASRRIGRGLIRDLYGNEIAEATGSPNVPSAGSDGVRVYATRSQRIKVRESRKFERVDRLGGSRIFPEEIARDPARWVMLCRDSMLPELAKAGCLNGAGSVWSSWPGYLRPEFGHAGKQLRAHGLDPEIAHTSGHARVVDLQRLATSLAPTKVVPIHTNSPQSFQRLFERVEVREDNEWWEV